MARAKSPKPKQCIDTATNRAHVRLDGPISCLIDVIGFDGLCYMQTQV